MVDLYELKQLQAFADLGTLSKVAEAFHVSTPSVTRTMQHLEEYYGVPLFTRGKNRIELNETGRFAVESARKLLRGADQAVQQVRDFDARQKTIVVRSCAPAPLWELIPKLNNAFPGMTVSSCVSRSEEVQAAWNEKQCDLAVLPFYQEGSTEFLHENLYVCVPPSHELAQHTSLSFAEINGFNFLLRSELGFWDALCREKMPASKFLVQADIASFDELVRASSLPCFTTDYGQLRHAYYPSRVNIPILDAEAQVTFYALSRLAAVKL